MSGASPYAVLGVSPGASRAAVERAYRALMKEHHPDLPGGDPERAAVINRAYAQLRGQGEPRLVELVAPATLAHRRLSAAGWLGLAMIGGAVLLAPLPTIRINDPQPVPGRPAPAVASHGSVPAAANGDPALLPDMASIEAAVVEAARLSRTGEPDRVDRYSEACEADLKAVPGPALLDHCIAFDVATALTRKPKDSRFSANAMATRHVLAAVRVEADPILAQARVNAVRGQASRLAAGAMEPR